MGAPPPAAAAAPPRTGQCQAQRTWGSSSSGLAVLDAPSWRTRSGLLAQLTSTKRCVNEMSLVRQKRPAAILLSTPSSRLALGRTSAGSAAAGTWLGVCWGHTSAGSAAAASLAASLAASSLPATRLPSAAAADAAVAADVDADADADDADAAVGIGTPPSALPPPPPSAPGTVAPATEAAPAGWPRWLLPHASAVQET
eukprot:scaffold66458_cov45-Phaeocystis_antarctica.AAC.1